MDAMHGKVVPDKVPIVEYVIDNSTMKVIIDACTPGGKFALGAGNSISSYIPVENYLTMIDEALNTEYIK